ncbi:hypothetical protein MSG28_008515, partial [Choristoneura fumiferana]
GRTTTEWQDSGRRKLQTRVSLAWRSPTPHRYWRPRGVKKLFCLACGRTCRSRIGLVSHQRRCAQASHAKIRLEQTR